MQRRSHEEPIDACVGHDIDIFGPADAAAGSEFDFIALKNITRAITEELDHRMMLPTKNPVITLEESAKSVRVRYKDREWVFPRGDCVLLPIENTTAELLARWIAERLRGEIHKQHRFIPQVLRVEVEENIGQSATCELRA